jgi:hypothetical protein
MAGQGKIHYIDKRKLKKGGILKILFRCNIGNIEE